MLKLMLLDDHSEDEETVERIVKTLADVEWMGRYRSPRDALLAAMKDVPDVVIAAVELQEMNGLAFTSKLQDILPTVRVIVSAYSGDYARAAFEAGAQGYLIKPVDGDSLLKALNLDKSKNKE